MIYDAHLTLFHEIELYVVIHLMIVSIFKIMNALCHKLYQHNV